MFHDAGTTEAGRLTQTFSCSGCGGRPVWHPESGKLKCPYCGHFTDVTADETKPEEYPLEAAPTAAQQDWGEKKRVVRCQGCVCGDGAGRGGDRDLVPLLRQSPCIGGPGCGGHRPGKRPAFQDPPEARRQRLPQMAEEALVRAGKGQENGDARSDQRRLSAPLDL